ncbi:SIS domain-containing protein [Schnuerera sp. xch1]|uniref:SIS domain-containing protein n=1 Tax=Schnuerera sp. xch1 TaxID=2874283 RepID=UPI001CBBB92D|nr:SIS domain-containing protein [Schnuerera sp. xch1]MBZ2174956.1 SIS domain-containing protein [Schnuerera sp. xch1]
MSYKRFFDTIEDMINDVKDTQYENIKRAGEIIADSIMNGGIVQSFGSGHSFAGALEISHRAGGLIPTKAIKEPAQGKYEMIEGVGSYFVKEVDVRENDCFVLISNSGRNPLPIEIAQYVKEKGNKIIVVTSLEASKKLKSRHSSGKKLYELADVILDNRGVEGDAAIHVEGMETKVCGTSSITAAVLLQATVLHAIEIMIERGYTPPVYMSQNVDGGLEFNERLQAEYAHRLFRV